MGYVLNVAAIAAVIYIVYLVVKRYRASKEGMSDGIGGALPRDKNDLPPAQE